LYAGCCSIRFFWIVNPIQIHQKYVIVNPNPNPLFKIQIQSQSSNFKKNSITKKILKLYFVAETHNSLSTQNLTPKHFSGSK
jgi:hypothetical protein